MWLPSLLRRQGYTTGAVDHLFAMKDWFIRGYDDYMPPAWVIPVLRIGDQRHRVPVDHRPRRRGLPPVLALLGRPHPLCPPVPVQGAVLPPVGRADQPYITDKLEGRPSYPLFKQNLYDFLESMPNLDYIADLYDDEAAYLDFEIGRLFAHLGECGLLEDTMVVLFGDHGENMTEHDSWFDRAGLYDSVVHVPLILWAPGRIAAVESSAMVALVDVMPTVLEVLGQPPAGAINGRSLMPLIEVRSAPIVRRSCSASPPGMPLVPSGRPSGS